MKYIVINLYFFNKINIEEVIIKIKKKKLSHR